MLLYTMFFGLFLVGDPTPYVEASWPQLMTETECNDIAPRVVSHMQKKANKIYPRREVEIKYLCLRAGSAI